MFNCACVYEFREVRISGAQRFYFVGALQFHDNVQTHLEGASIREGASNRDITAWTNFSEIRFKLQNCHSRNCICLPNVGLICEGVMIIMSTQG